MPGDREAALARFRAAVAAEFIKAKQEALAKLTPEQQLRFMAWEIENAPPR